MSHLQYTAKSHHLQWNVRQLSQICHHFYQNYCPDSFKHRRNVGLTKVSDESLLVLLLLQAELGITSQRHFYTICHLFPCGQLLERSRFNRRSRQLIWLVQFIRKAMNEMLPSDGLAIIDSFLLPLCQPVRNHRVTIFKGLADIGYNASKHLWFYGFKVHMLESADVSSESDSPSLVSAALDAADCCSPPLVSVLTDSTTPRIANAPTSTAATIIRGRLNLLAVCSPVLTASLSFYWGCSVLSSGSVGSLLRMFITHRSTAHTHLGC